VLRSNGTITSLLGGYSKNFEEEAFKEFGDKTKQFGHLFNMHYVEICSRKVFSYDVSDGTRLSFVFNKDGPPLDDNPTLSKLFTVAFKSFTSKLVPKATSPREGEVLESIHPQTALNNESDTLSWSELFGSSEQLLRLACDYETYVITQNDPIFLPPGWKRMLRTFKDDIRIAAVRSSCTLAAQLCSSQDKLACLQQALETSRALQNGQNEQIDVLSKAVQTLSLQVQKTEEKRTLTISQPYTVAHTYLTNIPLINRLPRIEENGMRMDKKYTENDGGEAMEFSNQPEEVSTDSISARNSKAIAELEKLLLTSKHAIFWLQRDLEAVKLERDSYYHQILELRRARQIYETKRRQEKARSPLGKPPGFAKLKPKAKGIVATSNRKTNTLNGQAGQKLGPNFKIKFKQEEE